MLVFIILKLDQFDTLINILLLSENIINRDKKKKRDMIGDKSKIVFGNVV